MPCGEKQKCGAQALPAAAKEIGGDFRDGRKGGFALPCKFLFDQNEVVTNQIKNLFDRQQGDSTSPELTLFRETGGRETCRLRETEEAPKILRGSGSKFVRR
jgi:hypothetical protein